MTNFPNLTIHHIRFIAEALTPIKMDAFKGSAIRGAWQSYINKAYCGAPPTVKATPEHQATCPVCYLTARDTGPESRRPFAIRPPLSRQALYRPGERFDFSFSLFGQHTLFLLPYIALGINEVGQTWGLGHYQPELNGRGRYRLIRIEAYNPHTNARQIIMPQGQRTIDMPKIPVTMQSVALRKQTLLNTRSSSFPIVLHFHTPLRLIHHSRLMRTFQFAAFFQRLAERAFSVNQHVTGQTPDEARDALRIFLASSLPLAEKVQVLQDELTWWDVKGYSSRLKRYHYLGGLVGKVRLLAENWEPLLPLLLWGESLQVGKNVVKGGGWFTVALAQ